MMDKELKEILSVFRLVATILVMISIAIVIIDREFFLPFILNTIALIFYVIVDYWKN